MIQSWIMGPFWQVVKGPTVLWLDRHSLGWDGMGCMRFINMGRWVSYLLLRREPEHRSMSQFPHSTPLISTYFSLTSKYGQNSHMSPTQHAALKWSIQSVSFLYSLSMHKYSSAIDFPKMSVTSAVQGARKASGKVIKKHWMNTNFLKIIVDKGLY